MDSSRREREDGCREECIERGGGWRWYNSCASFQAHRVICVSLPTSLTDTVVDGDINVCIELQCEGVGGGERIASLTPSVAPRTATIHGALSVWRRHAVNSRQHTILITGVEGEQENRSCYGWCCTLLLPPVI